MVFVLINTLIFCGVEDRAKNDRLLPPYNVIPGPLRCGPFIAFSASRSQSLIGAVFPLRSHPLNSFWLKASLGTVTRTVRKPHNTLARLDIAVADHKMTMRIVCVFSRSMNCREPGHAISGQITRKILDKLHTLFGCQFTRQRDPYLVNNACVFAVSVFSAVHPAPRFGWISWHMICNQFRLGIRAGNV